MQMMNLNPSLNTELMLKLVELKKNSIIKNIIEEENKFDPKYKTELCKKFQNTGKCPYGFKCRFAHGKEELIAKSQGLNYKKKPCKTFHEKGYCPYGSRCSFQHDERKFSELCFSYYYLQLFLLKNNNFYSSISYLNENKSQLINGRLPVFESFTQNLNNCSNQSESSNDLYEIGRTDSISTTSITSNEEERKKSLNYEIYFDNTLKIINNINDEQIKEKKNLKKNNEIYKNLNKKVE